MSWQQVKTPNLGITYTGGWCLKAVEDAFGTSHVFESAIDAWNAGTGKNHPGERPPAGVYTPVYFSLGNVAAGHVAIALPDGRIASSTQEGIHDGLYIHPNLDDLIRIYAEYHGTCGYLGWCEGIGTTPVVLASADPGGGQEDMDPHEIVRGLYRQLDPQYQPTDDVINAQANRLLADGKLDGVLHDILASKPWRNPQDTDVYALESYATADHLDNPHQFAVEKVLAGASPTQVLSEVLTALHSHIHDVEVQMMQNDAQMETNDEEVKTLKAQLAALQTPAPADVAPVTPAPAEPTLPADQTPPPAPVDVPQTPEPVETDPQPAPAKRGLLGTLVAFFWQVISELFLGGK